MFFYVDIQAKPYFFNEIQNIPRHIDKIHEVFTWFKYFCPWYYVKTFIIVDIHTNYVYIILLSYYV